MDHVLSDPQKRRLYRIAWTAVCLLWGGGFSLAVSAPDTVLGMIIVFAMAFGGFAWAAMDWSSGISKVLAKIGITTFAMRAAATVCLISFTILALNFVGSLAARSSTPETQLRTSVSGTSAPPVPNQNNASDASKRDVTKGVSGASAGCHPPVFSQQELSAFEQQATSGDAAAQCGLGMMYKKGQGVPQDYAQAALWFRKAAEQGNADGQCDLGVSYGNGEGVPQDYAQAALWFCKAAEQGHAHAQYNLGAWYEEGEDQGVPQDDTQAAFWRRTIRAWRAWINSADPYNWRDAQAAFWYRKAAEQGDADAQDALGDLYDKGQGVPQDYAQAALWYRKAAEQGLAEAQLGLGTLYGGGRSGPQDFVESYFWFNLAIAGKLDASDMERAVKLRDDTASILTPDEQSRVLERVRKWFEAHPAKPQ